MLRLVLGVLLSRRAQSACLLVLAILAIASGTAAPLYASAADRATVAAALASATPAERAVTFTTTISGVEGYASELDELARHVTTDAENALARVSGVVVAGQATTAAGDVAYAPVATRENECEHLTLLTGACATAPGEVMISEPTSRTLNAAVGTSFDFQPSESDHPTTLLVTAIYDPVAAVRDDDPYWAGRSDLTPRPLRSTNPMFVAADTIDTLEANLLVATVDLYLHDSGVGADSLASVEAALADLYTGVADIEVDDGVSRLFARIQASRDELSMTAPLGSVELLLVSWLVLLVTVAYTAVERRTEVVLGSLRGAPARHRALLTLGPTGLLLLVATPIGILLGWLVVNVVTSVTFAGSVGVALTAPALVVAAATLVIALVGAAIVERRAVGASVGDALRDVPARRHRSFGLIELAATLTCAVAIGQFFAAPDQRGGLVLLVPVLIALTIGLLVAGLVRPIATAVASDQLHRGRVSTAIAGFQLARRPGADRIMAMAIVAIALVGYSASAWNVATAGSREQAELELGAPRVLTVYAASTPELIAAVNRADPDGRWAMAATQSLDGDARLVGVDSSRLAAVALWPERATLSAADAAAAIHPTIAESVLVTGTALDITVTRTAGAPMHVIARLVGPAGEAITSAVDVGRPAGTATYRFALPECATAPGCRLAWLSFPRSPADIHVTALTQRSPDRTLLSGEPIEAASRWRVELGAESVVTIFTGASIEVEPDAEATSEPFVTLSYRPPIGTAPSTDIRLYVNDAPIPLPVIAAHPRPAGNGSATDPSNSSVQEEARSSPVLPGIARKGVLFDLDYASRITLGQDSGATLQVWLGKAAPDDAVQRLDAAGLQVLSDETLASWVAHEESLGSGLATRLQFVASALVVVVVLLGLLVVAATDRRLRAGEFAALRAQGVSSAAAARAAAWGNVAMILVAAPIGAATAALMWTLRRPVAGDQPLPQPDLTIPLAAIILATLILLVGALLAARSLIGASVEKVAEVPR
jgi:putative ABC transport system permease protein